MYVKLFAELLLNSDCEGQIIKFSSFGLYQTAWIRLSMNHNRRCFHHLKYVLN